MKRGHLIFIYFICYVAVMVVLSLKLFTFRLAERELKALDEAIEIAGEKTAQVLGNHVYEENPEQLLRKTFVYAFSFCRNETEEDKIEENAAIIDRIYVGINGEMAEFEDLMDVTDDDVIALYIVLNDFTIQTPFRSFVISREYYREVER